VFVVIKSAVAVVLRVPSYVWIYAVIFLYFLKVVIYTDISKTAEHHQIFEKDDKWVAIEKEAFSF